MRILEVYEARSGQKVNIQKTSIIFSRNISATKSQEILSLSSFSKTQRIDTIISKSKIQSFNSIKDRVQQRLNNWKVKFLS
jgi:hypothetical protein